MIIVWSHFLKFTTIQSKANFFLLAKDREQMRENVEAAMATENDDSTVEDDATGRTRFSTIY